jgi:hypothetical protein
MRVNIHGNETSIKEKITFFEETIIHQSNNGKDWSNNWIKEMIKKIILGILLILPCALNAQQPQFNVTQYRGGFDGEKLTVSNSSKALTASVYNPAITDSSTGQNRADYAVITVETDAIRYWPCTGILCTVGAPTSTTGHLVPVNGSFTIWGFSNIQNIRMIRVTTDATIQVSYYRFIVNVP